MKKIIIQLWLLIAPIIGFAQQNSWTPEQKDQFKREMDDFKSQMDKEMSQLRDSLAQMESQMKDGDWSQPDTMMWNFAVPPIPPPPGMMGDENSTMEIYAGDDSTEVRLGKWKLSVDEGEGGNDHVKFYRDENCCDEDNMKELKNIQTKFLLFDIGLNNYFASGLSSNFPEPYGPLEPNPGKSWVVNLHLFNQRINLIDHHLWFSYGAYFEFNSYKYNSEETMIPRIDSVAFQSSESALKKNKLSCTYIGIPLMLRYESNRSNLNHSFHVAAGGFGEYLIGSHTKTKSTSNDKIKQHDDFNLNRFRYGITGRIGYGWASLFVNYSLSEFFESGTGPVVYPASAGLALEF
ncbi:MAG: outer membrane beta-barrel protein [Chitinophagaceae bacterium]|nr:outer membrane beta-barrel protein [Chitinophagaceae bacterium]